MPDTASPIDDSRAAQSVCRDPTRASPAQARRALRDSSLALVALAALLGGIVGISVGVLHHAVVVMQELAFGLPAGQRLGQEPVVPAWRAVAVPALGGLLLGVLVAVARRFRPSEIVDPVEANALFGGKMSLIDSGRLTIATILSNGAGASVGMEAAYTQAGSGFVSAVGQKLRLRRGDLRTLVGCGAAAAIASAYGAPLAGAFYAFELVLGGYTLANLAPVGAAAGVAAAVAAWVAGPAPARFGGLGVGIDGWDYVAFALVGFLAGWLSIATMQLVTVAERAFRALPAPAWLRPALGGVGVGLLALWVPDVMGAGQGAEPPDLSIGIFGLGALMVTKMMASAVSLGAGFRGGLFSASLFLGGLFGGMLALLAGDLAPWLGLDARALVLVAMGSVAAGIVGGPLTMTLLVLEATSDLWAATGVLTGVVVSTTVVRQAFGYSFTTWRFHLRGVPIRGAQDVGWMGDLRAGRLMRRDAKTVREDLALADLRRLYPLGSAKMVFAVDEVGRYRGVLDMAAVHDPALDTALEGRTAGSMAGHAETFLLLGDDIRTVLNRFCDGEAEALPVVATTTDRRVLGYLTEAYALRRYSQELERLRGEETGQQGLYGRD